MSESARLPSGGLYVVSFQATRGYKFQIVSKLSSESIVHFRAVFIQLLKSSCFCITTL